MITENELQATQLSATKKDFYQVWNELIDTASKLSNRWDPRSTNESDPGIVLLKVLAGVADKLNYNIDKNTLEVYMPSAAQQESMRKLCDMMGYNIKYYQSATTDVKISYKGTDEILNEVYIDKFTNIKDEEDSINYVTLAPVHLSQGNTTAIVQAIEGELVQCETDDDNIISILQLDDNNRYILPEAQVAENGIFIYNIDDNIENEWTRVENLNTVTAGQKVYKIGFNSALGLPYVQFPNDIASIIADGLRISFIRTNGINGNISAKTLSKLESPTSWGVINSDNSEEAGKQYYSTEYYTATNITAATTGRNLETIDDAYSNYKKTIGTFDTLVTCRDYINKIYNMTLDNANKRPLVSNVIVSDIRSDINRASTLCTFNEYGICYQNISKPVDSLRTEAPIAMSVETFQDTTQTKPENYLDKVVRVTDINPAASGAKTMFYKKGAIHNGFYYWADLTNHLIDHFDLILYPFKEVADANTYNEFVNSFKYSSNNKPEILAGLQENKTISHNLIFPDDNEIACIKVYLKLRTKISTTKKVNILEENEILAKVYANIFKDFNLRKLDFGESLSLESIRESILKADSRIKEAPLEDPQIYIAICKVNGEEFILNSPDTTKMEETNTLYNKLVANNILAGRVALFNYDESFEPDFTESAYPARTDGTTYNSVYDEVASMESDLTIASDTTLGGNQSVQLKENEVVQFRLKNLKTIVTYPAYVNYFIHLDDAKRNNTPALPATMYSIYDYFVEYQNDLGPRSVDGKEGIYPDRKPYQNKQGSEVTDPIGWEDIINNNSDIKAVVESTGITFTSSETFASYLTTYKQLFRKSTVGDVFILATETTYIPNEKYYYLIITKDNYGALNNRLKEYHAKYKQPNSDLYAYNTGLYRLTTTDLSINVGYLVDNNHNKYEAAAKFIDLATWRVPQTFETDQTKPTETDSSLHAKTGLGQNSIANGIASNEEYELTSGECLYINYTKSDSTEVSVGGTSGTKTTVLVRYGAGTIIRPNFEVIDSLAKRSERSYDKTTSGLNWDKATTYGTVTLTEAPAGLFTLGANEQIEIRDYAQVELDEISTNLYWLREDEDDLTDLSGKIIFAYDEDPVDIDTWMPVVAGAQNSIYTSYTLKPNEYLFYTDKDRLDLAYYGSGTKITRSKNTPDLIKYKTEQRMTAEEVEVAGLVGNVASIPWKAYNLSTTTAKQAKIILTEYQYINLLAGDTLVGVSDSQRSKDFKEATRIELTISSTPVNCTSATYRIAGSDANTTLPPVTITGLNWQVSSKLEFNVGPTLTQTLHSSGLAKESIKLYNKNNVVLAELTPQNIDETTPNIFEDLSIRASKALQQSRSKVDVTTKEIGEDGLPTGASIADMKIKIFKQEDIQTATGSILNYKNFGKGKYTKIDFVNYPSGSELTPYVTLHANISQRPRDAQKNFGLLFMYYIEENPNIGDSAYIVFNKHSTETFVPMPSIFNYENNSKLCDQSTGWWKDRLIETQVTIEGKSVTIIKHHLRPGVNIIKIEDGYDISIYPDANKNGTLIFGDLDLVKYNRTYNTSIRKLDYDYSETLNSKLCYKVVTASRSAYEQALFDIAALDTNHEFYYNLLQDSTTMIDLNYNDETDTMESASTWYDYNNINNKFVVSEIDASYLTTGIKISKTSQL